MFVSCILVGAGKGVRLKNSQSKSFVKVGSKPLFLWSLKKFLDIKEVKEIILVLRAKDVKKARSLIKKIFPQKSIKVTSGGSTRSLSVRNGLKKADPKANYVMVHDVARLFVEKKEILKLLSKVKRCAGCALGSKTSKTLKRVRETRKGYRIIEHVKREELFEIHTPQVFKKDVIMRAYTSFFNKDALDDAQIVSRAGYDVYIVEGSHMNIKITYPQDLVMAREVLG